MKTKKKYKLIVNGEKLDDNSSNNILGTAFFRILW